MKPTEDPSRFHERAHRTSADVKYRIRLEEYFSKSIGSFVERLENFPKYVPRQKIAYFISRYEIFKNVLNIQGSIIECGVLFGGGLMTWAKISAVLEPYNFQREVIGFDTFAGFPELSEEDRLGKSEFSQPGELSVDSYDDLLKCIELYDANRFMDHIPKVKLVRGDARTTIPEFVQANPHLVVSLLYIDFDIFEPSKVAIEHFLPRMPKGAVIAFDDLNNASFPGETVAALQAVGIQNLRIERYPWDNFLSFAILE